MCSLVNICVSGVGRIRWTLVVSGCFLQWGLIAMNNLFWPPNLQNAHLICSSQHCKSSRFQSYSGYFPTLYLQCLLFWWLIGSPSRLSFCAQPNLSLKISFLCRLHMEVTGQVRLEDSLPEAAMDSESCSRALYRVRHPLTRLFEQGWAILSCLERHSSGKRCSLSG